MVVGNDYYPPFSEGEYQRRYRNVREAMKKKGLDCLLIYGAHHCAGTDTGHVNAVYLSNYAAVIHSYVVFPLQGEPSLLIVVPYHVPNARDISVIEDIRAVGTDLELGAAQRLKELDLEKANIGIVGPVVTPWGSFTIPVEHYHCFTKTFPEASFQVVTSWYEELRLVKSEEEIGYLEKGAAMTDLAHEEVFMATRPGVRHSDLRQIAESVAGRFGGKFPFSHIGSTSMANPQRFYPDFFPTHRTIEAGDSVMTEISIGYGGYFGKIFGTYFVGEPTREYREMFELAASVFDRTLRELKPGDRGRDVAKFLEPVQEAGYTTGMVLIGGWSTYNHPPYVGALAGSLGAGVPEPSKQKPALKGAGMEDPAALDFAFKPGHCIGIMPHIVTPDMKRGVWVGTICVVTKDGVRNLHSYPANKLRVV